MPRAYLTIPHDRPYVPAFRAGLQAVGYDVALRPPGQMEPDDVLVTWNLKASNATSAARAREAGAKHVVAENGYYGKDLKGRQHYAMALGGHNGSGYWYAGGPERWDVFQEDLQPWRVDGDGPIVICDQRSIGSPEMASPRDFERQARALCAERLPGVDVIYRPHPAYNKSRGYETPPLEEHLATAQAVLTWASQAATQAVVQGIPSFYMAPFHSAAGATVPAYDWLFPAILNDWNRFAPNRLEGLVPMAWAQWDLGEIECGMAFHCLLGEGPKTAPSVQLYGRRQVNPPGVAVLSEGAR